MSILDISFKIIWPDAIKKRILKLTKTQTTRLYVSETRVSVSSVRIKMCLSVFEMHGEGKVRECIMENRTKCILFWREKL